MTSDPARDSGDSHESLLDRFNGPIPRWLMYVLIPGVVGPVLILVFIFVSEIAHDEARCTYTRASVQKLDDRVSVREDARSCLPGIEERRFSLVRAGAEQVLGRRRFASAAFARGQYQWHAELSPRGEVRVTVDNPGHTQAVFREGTPEEKK